MSPARGALALAAAAAAVYANAIGASFQFDDWNAVVDPKHVQSLAAWWASMPGIRPLLKLSYALNHAVSDAPPPYHAVNVLIHVLAVLLVFRLLLRVSVMLGAPETESRRVAIFAAAVFALHPVQTEAVTYVSGRSTSMASLFALASLCAWVEGRERGDRLLRFAVSPALFAAALATKETSVVLPLAVALIAAVDPREPASPRRVFRSALPHLLVAGAALAALAAVPKARALAAVSFGARGVATNLRTQAEGVVYLIGQLVRLDRLNADPRLPVVTEWTPKALVCAALLLALALAAMASIRRRPAFAFGVAWFFLWLAPTNSFVPRLDVANDRQLYLAMVGPAFLLAWSARGPARRSPRAAWAAGLALAVVLGGATVARNRVYRNEVVFWEDVVRKTPRNARAFNNLGYAYALAGRSDDAEAAFGVALTLEPEDPTAAINLDLLLKGKLTPE